MNKYNEWLNLDFDPFLPGAAARDFYCSGHRQALLDQIVEFSLYSNAMIAVTGPLGAGKSTLAANFCDRFAEEAVCIKVAATLFMNEGQFLESLQAALPFKSNLDQDVDAAIKRLSNYAAELDLEARSLILIIDDAHELSAEVLQLLTKLLESSVDSSIHALLFGENQLDNLLQSTLNAAAQERLAVFPLEGFASDETQEYIRFKLAAAGHTNDLPIGGGIIGAIHNSSQGMPGVINNLIIDALNAAAPGSEPIHIVEDEDFGPMFGGERMEQLDDLDERELELQLEEDEAEEESSERAWIGVIQPRYWLSAAALVVLLTGTLLFWDTAPNESEPVPIPVAVTPDAAPALLSEPAAAIPTPAIVAAVPVAENEEPLATETVERADAGLVAVSPAVGDASLSDTVAAIDEPEIQALAAQPTAAAETVVPAVPVEVVAEKVEEIAEDEAAEIVAEVAEIEEPAETLVLAEASSFEERLLRASPEDFAVQLLASHSEENIKGFLTQFGSDQPVGYFETRHQGRPWFVALLAEFDDRSQATQAISALPAQLRANQPWIRSVAGIQTDIRELLNSKLVSSQ